MNEEWLKLKPSQGESIMYEMHLEGYGPVGFVRLAGVDLRTIEAQVQWLYNRAYDDGYAEGRENVLDSLDELMSDIRLTI